MLACFVFLDDLNSFFESFWNLFRTFLEHFWNLSLAPFGPFWNNETKFFLIRTLWRDSGIYFHQSLKWRMGPKEKWHLATVVEFHCRHQSIIGKNYSKLRSIVNDPRTVGIHSAVNQKFSLLSIFTRISGCREWV